MSSVKVAVRVRPFNSREIARSCKPCIRMEGKRTTIFQGDKSKGFEFDHSYMSMDPADKVRLPPCSRASLSARDALVH